MDDKQRIAELEATNIALLANYESVSKALIVTRLCRLEDDVRGIRKMVVTERDKNNYLEKTIDDLTGRLARKVKLIDQEILELKNRDVVDGIYAEGNQEC